MVVRRNGEVDLPLIKAKDAETKLAQAEVLRFQDVEAEAQRVLVEARAQADAILADARARGERLRADAHRTGIEAGRTEGLRIGQELGRKQALDQALADFAGKHAALIKALAGALEQFELRRRGLQSALERDVIALAGAIASRVIKRAVDIDPACVTHNLREALQLIASRNRLEIRLHPEDREHATQFAKDLLQAHEYDAVDFVADETVGRGGVLLRTAGGQVDAAIQTQWIRILDEILAGWQEHWLLSPTILAETESFPADAEDESGYVELVQGEAADLPAESDAQTPPAAVAAQQAVIDQAISQAMLAAASRQDALPAAPAAGELAGLSADESPAVEEIDPREVEDIDPGKVEETDSK